MRVGEEVQEVPRGAPELSDLTVAVAADRSEVPLGTSLRITVTVTNASSAPRTLQFASACRTDFELVDSLGTVVATADRMCAQMITEATLAPEASFAEEHVWVRDDSAPGKYALHGVLLTTEDRVRSAPIVITVG